MVSEEVLSILSPTARSAVKKLSTEEQDNFIKEFNTKKKDPTLMLILAIFFPIQLFFLGKTGLGIAFFLTGGGCGIWWIIEIVLANKRTKEYNEEIATQIIRDIKIINS